MVESKELGRFEEARNGVKINYKIQTITPQYYDGALDLMLKYFITREPMSSYERLHEFPSAVKSISDLWKETMEAGATLVALEETKDGGHKIIGANMTLISYKEDDKIEEIEHAGFNKVLTALKDITKKANIFDVYNTDKYLSAYGLTVHPDYHGYKVGYRLLECRKPLCTALGVQVTGTVFTAASSQYIAKKCGFKTLSQQDYKTFEYNGELAFPNLDGDMKFMALKYS